MALTREQIIQEITNLQKKRQDMRAQEKEIVANSKLIREPLVVSSEGDLRSNISKVLPKHLVPTNVGKYRQTLIPYWYRVEFALGANPTITNLFSQEQSFQIEQDAGFLLTTISRYTKDQGEAGFKIPLGMTITDNQSTRQFTNDPIPLNSIGYRGRPTKLITPLLLQPNASVRITLTALQRDITGWSQALVGDGYQMLIFSGYRVKMADEAYLTENIFL